MSESRRYALACLPGDGIGPEVIAETRKVIDAAASRHAFGVEWTDYPFGAGRYLKTGEILPDSAVDEMAGCDALLLGAVGDPRVRPGILERGILLHLRFQRLGRDGGGKAMGSNGVMNGRQRRQLIAPLFQQPHRFIGSQPRRLTA